MKTRADQLHRNDAYLYDGWVYKIAQVLPPDTKKELSRFLAESPVKTIVTHEWNYSDELEMSDFPW